MRLILEYSNKKLYYFTILAFKVIDPYLSICITSSSRSLRMNEQCVEDLVDPDYWLLAWLLTLFNQTLCRSWADQWWNMTTWDNDDQPPGTLAISCPETSHQTYYWSWYIQPGNMRLQVSINDTYYCFEGKYYRIYCVIMWEPIFHTSLHGTGSSHPSDLLPCE